MNAPAIKSSVFGKFRTKNQAVTRDFSKKALVPIRHLDFKFDAKELNDKFFMHSESASAFFQALSIFLTFGEDLVIETARYHRDFLTDPILKQRVTALIGQEAIHSKIHDEWNDILIPHDFPVTLYRFLAKQVFDYGLLKLPQPMKLSMMAGIEHFTAVLAEFMMKHEEIFDLITDDDKTKAMWQWHMLEESEHKDIAYDVFQTLSGSYALRMSGFALATLVIFGGVSAGAVMIPFFRKPSNLIRPAYWKDAVHGTGLLFGPKEGVFGSTIGHILDYFRPDFHPNDHDTSEYLAYYKAKLLNREDGLLARFLTKEIIPKLQAA